MTSPSPSAPAAATRTTRLASRSWRVGAGILGALLLGLAGLFGVGAALGADAQEGASAWYAIASMALFALVLAAIGLQLAYLAVTGRRRGPVHRWLEAFADAWTGRGW